MLKTTRTMGKLAIAGVLLAAVLAVPASAAPTRGIKPKKLVLPWAPYLLPAVDGADVYWISYKKVKQGKGYRHDVLVNRSSLINRSRVRLAQLPEDGGYVAESVIAGGGQVVVNLEKGGFNSALETRVIRIGRDGSNHQVLATGSKPGWDKSGVVEGDRARPNDCGTYVHAQSMTATGSVVLMQTAAERESTACGGKPNFDRLRVTEVSLTGATREIYTDDISLEDSRSLESDAGTGSGALTAPGWPDGSNNEPMQTRVRVVGDRAIYVKLTGGPAYVRDLNTGALTGPYGTGLKLGRTVNFATLDPFGRVAMAALSERASQSKPSAAPPRSWYAHRAGIFNTPLSPVPFTHLHKLRSVQFCGSRLIGATKDAYIELDPDTARIRRTVVRFPPGRRAFGLNDQCTDGYAYIMRPSGNKVTILGFPLG